MTDILSLKKKEEALHLVNLLIENDICGKIQDTINCLGVWQYTDDAISEHILLLKLMKLYGSQNSEK